VVAALAANASSSSAWSIVGVSGFAYRQGLSAVWLLPGVLGGFLLNYLVVAPRLVQQTGSAVTLTEFLAGPPGTPGRRALVWTASGLTLACLLVYVAAQMQAAGSAFTHAFQTPAEYAILLGAAVTVAYTLCGGYLAVSLTDTLQGMLMVLVAVGLPVAAVLHFGGVGPLAAAIGRLEEPGYGDWFGARSGSVALGFVLSLGGIGLGYPGQPHAVNKYMGMAPTASLRTLRVVGLCWAGLLYCGMLVVGWATRAAFPLPAGSHEDALYALSQQVLPPLIDGLVLAAVLAAIMSTVDSQLLVCASCVTHDLGLGTARPLLVARATVLGIGVGATAAAMAVPKNVFDHVLFAWAALGSAFGPLLLVRLCRGPLAPGAALASMLAGGGLAITGHFLPLWSPGFADRVLSWLVALAIAWLGVRPERRGAARPTAAESAPPLR
jgi:sodium/proline symporter